MDPRRFDFIASKEAALQNADALIICTEWPAFRAPDFDFIKSQLKQPLIFDGRNLYDPMHMREKGIYLLRHWPWGKVCIT